MIGFVSEHDLLLKNVTSSSIQCAKFSITIVVVAVEFMVHEIREIVLVVELFLFSLRKVHSVILFCEACIESRGAG